MALIDYSKRKDVSEEWRLKTLKESVQRALDEVDRKFAAAEEETKTLDKKIESLSKGDGGGGGSTTPAIVSLGKKIADDTATQSISTTLTKLNIGTTTTVNTDPSAFTITAGRVTCNRAGVVRVDASVYVAHGTSAGYQALHIYKNGVEQMSTREYAAGSFIGSLNCAQYFEVEAGDYFEIYGRANASSRFYTENRATTLDVMYIS